MLTLSSPSVIRITEIISTSLIRPFQAPIVSGKGSAIMPVTRRQIVAALPAAALAASLPRVARAEDGRKVVTFWFGQANADGQAALRSDLVDAFNASQDKYLLQME